MAKQPAKSGTGSRLRAFATAPSEYRRALVLGRLAGIASDRIGEPTPEAARAVAARLLRAVREERERGRAGHWSYSAARLRALRQALRAERQRLCALRKPSEERVTEA